MKLATSPRPDEHFVNAFSMLSRNLQDVFPIIANPDLFLQFLPPQFRCLLQYNRLQPEAA